MAATKKDDVALQTATREGWLSSLHEYLAIRAAFPSLAWVRNKRISEVYKRDADTEPRVVTCAQKHAGEIYGPGCRHLHSNPSLPSSGCWPLSPTLFLLLRKRARAKRNLINRHSLLKVAILLLDMDRRFGAPEDRASFVLAVHDEDCKNKMRQVRK